MTATVHNRLNAGTPVSLDGQVLSGSAIERVDDIGEGQIVVPADTDAPYRSVVRFGDRAAFRVTKKSIVKVHEALDARTVTLSGPSLESWLKETLLLPATGEAWPQPSVRRFDWTAPEIDAATVWTAPKYIQPRNDLLWGRNRPTAWPEPFSVWLHTLPPATPHPAGVYYWHRTFTSSGPVWWGVTASDEFEAAIDGALVQRQELAAPNDNTVWPHTFRQVMRQLPAGTHTIRIKVTVVNPTGAAGFISSGFAVTAVGIGGPLFATGVNPDPSAVNGGWSALANPVSAPGLTSTRILQVALAEAALRGANVPSVSFTATHDSGGQAAPVLPGFMIPVPCTLWDLVQALGLEVKWDPSGWAFDAFVSRGGPSGVSWTAGVDVLEHRVEGVA